MEELDRIGRKISNFAYADAIICKSEYTGITIKDGCAESIREGKKESITIRILQNGAFGFSSSNKISDLDKVILEAKKLSRIGEGKIKMEKPQVNCAKTIAKVKKNPLDASTKEKISKMLEFEKIAQGSSIKSTTANYFDSKTNYGFSNSQGAQIEELEIRCGAGIFVYAAKNGKIESSFEQVKEKAGMEVLDGFPKKVEKAKSESIALLDATHGPKGRMEAILDPELAGVFSHEAIGHACEADGIMNDSSILRGKIGERIGNEVVSIMDSPIINEGLWGAYKFDDEGTLASGTCLVRNGILQSYLTSLESSIELNGLLTGNARGDGHMRQIVRMSNTYFEKGNSKTEELFDEMRNGIYLVGCKEGQVLPKTGNFTFAAKYGYIIKNGERTKLVRDCSINGNILESLHGIDMVAKDLEFLPGTCGKDGQSASVTTGSPHLKIRKILVG
ncbi:MAG: TldD/PmbA family protein [Candidatus Micrarchaeota archaeon]